MFCLFQEIDDFLVNLSKNHKVPEYILILLKINGYTTDASIRKAVQDPENFLNMLEESGKRFSSNNFYPKHVKEKFTSSCMEVYVDPDQFTLLPGHRDLLRVVFEDFSKKPASRKSKIIKQDKEEKIEQYFTEKNKTKLTDLLRTNFRKFNVMLPEVFKMKEESGSAWSVECPICKKYLKVYLSQYGNNIQFNSGFF